MKTKEYELLEVYDNGALTHVYPVTPPEHHKQSEPFEWWCKVTNTTIDLDIVTDLARIGMIDWLFAAFPGVVFENHNGAPFHALLELCRGLPDWRRDTDEEGEG